MAMSGATTEMVKKSLAGQNQQILTGSRSSSWSPALYTTLGYVIVKRGRRSRRRRRHWTWFCTKNKGENRRLHCKHWKAALRSSEKELKELAAALVREKD